MRLRVRVRMRVRVRENKTKQKKNKRLEEKAKKKTEAVEEERNAPLGVVIPNPNAVVHSGTKKTKEDACPKHDHDTTLIIVKHGE